MPSSTVKWEPYLFIGFQMIHEIIQSIDAFFYSEVETYLFIRFQMIHEIIQSIDAFFYSEVELMVGGAQLVGDLPGSQQIWRPLNPYAEGVKGMRPVKGILGLFEMPTVSQLETLSVTV